MIKSAHPYPVHTLLSYEGNTLYQVPPYQREYSWQKAQWEELFDDLIESDGPHFLGTIITLNQSLDSVDAVRLELIDGQQRMTTLTLLMAAVYSVLHEHKADLDEDTLTDLTNLRRQLVRKGDAEPRLRPQKQGNNRDDYVTVLHGARLPVQSQWVNYMPLRRIHRCWEHFRTEISDLARDEGLSRVDAALRVLAVTQRAVLVKIEVASHADAFVLFESLNNRGMPLTPVDLIKNHLLARAEQTGTMTVDEAFSRWSQMLAGLGDNYANQERFLRHYFNAFKADLPEVPNATVATRSNLIRIYEQLVEDDVTGFLDAIVPASRVYGRITGVIDEGEPLDAALRRLSRAQGAPSYVLMLWLMTKQAALQIPDTDLTTVADLLTSFFVRRNLTGHPATYTLPRLFMGIIEAIAEGGRDDLVAEIRDQLRAATVDDDAFREKLRGPIYEENSEVARFILATLSEDAMTKETGQDLWQREKGRHVWTIEHILPQGPNLPQSWLDMLGDAAADIQATYCHQLGNLTITRYNSNLGNKSFAEKRDRADSKGRPIGYRNGLSLNADLVGKTAWGAADIEERTHKLADQVAARFTLEPV